MDEIEINESAGVSNAPVEKNKIYLKGILLGIIIGILLVFSVYGCISLVQSYKNKQNAVSDNVLDEATLKKIQNIQKIVDSNLYQYDENVTKDKLEEGIYRGMMESIGDKYAEYYSVEDMLQVSNDTEGVSYGIGCYVTMNDDEWPEIYGVMDDSPAKEVGIREGDIIAEVEGESTHGHTLQEVVSMIKGLEDTTVDIVISRDGEPIEFTVTRKKQIETTTVEYGLLIDNDEIGYIRIKEFDDVTVGQFKEGLSSLRDENIKGLILDLRSNPGGNLSAVVDIARELLPEGLIVYTENNKGVRKEYTCDGSKELDIPLVVLINQYSASASEILSGAIKDYNKGTLIGTTTFGKGIVQTLLNVGDGSVIKLTTSAYFTPNGINIQGTGIEPDIELEYDYETAEKDGTDNQVNRAVEVLEDKIGD